MKLVSLIVCLILGSTLPVQAKNIRVVCGIGAAANPHNGSMVVALFRNSNMTTYRMLVLKSGLIEVEDDIVFEESQIEPTRQWPLLTATMRSEHKTVLQTFKMSITKALSIKEHTNGKGNFDFTAEGIFEFSLNPGQQFRLVCDGVFNPN